MLQSVLNNLKSIKPTELAKELKNIKPRDLVEEIRGKAQVNLEKVVPENIKRVVPNNLKNAASQATGAVNQAVTRAMVNNEGEIVKALKTAADKIIAGRNDVTEEVKEEIESIVTEFEMTPKGVYEHLKGTGGFLKNHIPRSFEDLKNFRSYAAIALIDEAQRRIAARKAAEVASRGGKPRHGHGGGHERQERHERHERKTTDHDAGGRKADQGVHGGAKLHATSSALPMDDEGTRDAAVAYDEEVLAHDEPADGIENPRVERGGHKRRKHARREEATH